MPLFPKKEHACLRKQNLKKVLVHLSLLNLKQVKFRIILKATQSGIMHYMFGFVEITEAHSRVKNAVAL